MILPSLIPVSHVSFSVIATLVDSYTTEYRLAKSYPQILDTRKSELQCWRIYRWFPPDHCNNKSCTMLITKLQLRWSVSRQSWNKCLLHEVGGYSRLDNRWIWGSSSNQHTRSLPSGEYLGTSTWSSMRTGSNWTVSWIHEWHVGIRQGWRSSHRVPNNEDTSDWWKLVQRLIFQLYRSTRPLLGHSSVYTTRRPYVSIEEAWRKFRVSSWVHKSSAWLVEKWARR